MKIKDLEKKVQMEHREAKYRNISSGATNTFRKSNREQTTNNQKEEIAYTQGKDIMSYDQTNSMHNKYPTKSNRQTPNSNIVHYNASPPVHMMNHEINLNADGQLER